MTKNWLKLLHYQLSMGRYRVRQAFYPTIEKQIQHRTFILRNIGINNRTDYDDAWFVALALHSEVVFDIGANLGLTALLTTFATSVRELVLVDANPIALSVAAENFINNHLSANARFVCAFVSDHPGETIRFWTINVGAAGSMYKTHAVTASTVNKSLYVPTTTIDELCVRYGLVPDLIKVDVEGAEALVLQGSLQCAQYQKTRYLVEVHSNTELPMIENAKRIINWCTEAGYVAWYMKASYRLETAEPVANRGRCHLLLQPADWEYPNWLKIIPQKADIALALDQN